MHFRLANPQEILKKKSGKKNCHLSFICDIVNNLWWLQKLQPSICRLQEYKPLAIDHVTFSIARDIRVRPMAAAWQEVHSFHSPAS